MKYRVEIPRSVEKEVSALPNATQIRVHEKILGLEEDPRPAGCKQLIGSGYWRIRVGDYRIVYAIDDAARLVVLTRVRHRKEVYRGLS
ncbi:MAG: type II toxin-antitoxin system RelE/ParE family toxin [Nitrospirae bacterium]|nr:type II toxin-antitoxin system RelE/ParE family toxin [Nitrospirota bacterium]